jgi:hypothetical protein
MYENPFAILSAWIWVVLGIIVALYLVSWWRIFEKAGRPGWKGIIPFYNIFILLKIVGKPGWWLILMCIPVVNAIYIIWTYNMLSKSFGKDEAFTVGLFLVGYIFFPVLAFSDARYIGPFGDQKEFAERSLHNYEFGKE